MRYQGADVRARDPLELRREVGLVPQLPALVEGSVEKNIRFAARLGGTDPDVGRLLDLAGSVPVPAQKRGTPWPELRRRTREARAKTRA